MWWYLTVSLCVSCMVVTERLMERAGWGRLHGAVSWAVIGQTVPYTLHRVRAMVRDIVRDNVHTHTHTHLTALCPGLPRWAGTRKVKPIWILLKQETVSGSGISWAMCKYAPRSRQKPRQHPTTQFFTGQVPFLPANQQRQSTEGMG